MLMSIAPSANRRYRDSDGYGTDSLGEGLARSWQVAPMLEALEAINGS